MRSCLLLPALLVLILAAPGRAEDDLKPILEKAVKAHGGREKLEKLRKVAVQSRIKGKIEQLGGIDITGETSGEEGKFKQIIRGSVAGTAFTQTVTYDGKNMRIYVNDKEIKLDDKKLNEEAQEQIYVEKLVGMAFFQEKGYELSPLGESKVEGRPALGVQVASKGHRDVNLWFDKEKGLLIKTESRGLDFQSQQEVTREKILSDYKDKGGFLVPTQVVVKQDGKVLMTLELEDVKLVDSFDKDFFTKP